MPEVWPYHLGCCDTWELDRMVSACIVWHVSLVNVLTLTAVADEFRVAKTDEPEQSVVSSTSYVL